MKPSITTLVLFICLNNVYGWGPDGHALVASIAQNLLTNDSLVFVRTHLPWYTSGNVSMLASWPDYIIYPETNPVDYLNWQWSKQLHYVNTKDWSCVYDREQDCNWSGQKSCVDGSIQNYTQRLADSQQDDIQREQALKFLVHFIGDVHQPLHAGFQGDEGGNTIRGRFFDKETNLHSIWDTGIIERRINDDFHSQPSLYLQYLLDQMNTTYAQNISDWIQCSGSDESKYLACATNWIVEDSKLNCDLVYRDENNQPMNSSTTFDLNSIYYKTRLIIVEQRLIQAGLRLGTVINKIVQSIKYEKISKKHCHQNTVLVTFLILQLSFILMLTICLVTRRHRSSNDWQMLTNTNKKQHSIVA